MKLTQAGKPTHTQPGFVELVRRLIRHQRREGSTQRGDDRHRPSRLDAERKRQEETDTKLRLLEIAAMNHRLDLEQTRDMVKGAQPPAGRPSLRPDGTVRYHWGAGR